MEELGSAVVTVMPSSPIATLVNNGLTLDQIELDISEDAGVEKFIDDLTWEPIAAKLADAAQHGRIRGGILIHPGTTMNHRHRCHNIYGYKGLHRAKAHKVRTETCLAMRLLWFCWTFVQYAIPFASLVPAAMSSTAVSLIAFQEWSELRKYVNVYSLHHDNVQLEFITNLRDNVKDIRDLLTLFNAREPPSHHRWMPIRG